MDPIYLAIGGGVFLLTAFGLLGLWWLADRSTQQDQQADTRWVNQIEGWK